MEKIIDLCRDRGGGNVLGTLSRNNGESEKEMGELTAGAEDLFCFTGGNRARNEQKSGERGFRAMQKISKGQRVGPARGD